MYLSTYTSIWRLGIIATSYQAGYQNNIMRPAVSLDIGWQGKKVSCHTWPCNNYFHDDKIVTSVHSCDYNECLFCQWLSTWRAASLIRRQLHVQHVACFYQQANCEPHLQPLVHYIHWDDTCIALQLYLIAVFCFVCCMACSYHVYKVAYWEVAPECVCVCVCVCVRACVHVCERERERGEKTQVLHL